MSSLAFTLSSSCSGLILCLTHWTSCWCLNGLNFIPTHPMDVSQERHALHTERINCPPRECPAGVGHSRRLVRATMFNSYDHPTSSAPKGVRFLFFCSTALVLSCVLLLNGHLSKHNHVACNVERMKLLYMAGNSSIIVPLPGFFSSFRLFLTSFASTLLKKGDWMTQ